MSYTIVPELCINCGGCEFTCPTEAIRPPAADVSQPAVFWIETHRCNDCGSCVRVCPTDGILPDPDTFACAGHGCPIAPDRGGAFAGWECSQLEAFCDGCGHTLWRPGPGGEWECIRCESKNNARRQLCPKVLALEKAKTGQQRPRRSIEELHAHRDLMAAGRGGER